MLILHTFFYLQYKIYWLVCNKLIIKSNLQKNIQQKKICLFKLLPQPSATDAENFIQNVYVFELKIYIS